jgi:hypothetical protein
MLLGTCYSPEHTDQLSTAMKHHHQLPATSSTSRTSATSSTSSSPASSTSLFTIDSILAPRPSHQSTAPHHVLSPHQRLPPAMLHHPLHLGHLAAAAASGFSATSADFLGKQSFQLTQCRVLLEKLTVTQLVKKFPTLYGPRGFMTVFTRACHWILFWASSIQFHSFLRGLLFEHKEVASGLKHLSRFYRVL